MFDYFTKIRDIKLHYSGGLPCINVGKPNRPTYFPIEVRFSLCVSCFLTFSCFMAYMIIRVCFFHI